MQSEKRSAYSSYLTAASQIESNWSENAALEVAGPGTPVGNALATVQLYAPAEILSKCIECGVTHLEYLDHQFGTSGHEVSREYLDELYSKFRRLEAELIASMRVDAGIDTVDQKASTLNSLLRFEEESK